MNKRERIIIGLVLIGCAALVGFLAQAISLALALVVGYLAGRHGLLERFGLTGVGGVVDDKDPIDVVFALLLAAVLVSALVHAVVVAAIIAGVTVLIWGVPYWLLRDQGDPFRRGHQGVAPERPQLEDGDS